MWALEVTFYWSESDSPFGYAARRLRLKKGWGGAEVALTWLWVPATVNLCPLSKSAKRHSRNIWYPSNRPRARNQVSELCSHHDQRPHCLDNVIPSDQWGNLTLQVSLSVDSGTWPSGWLLARLSSGLAACTGVEKALLNFIFIPAKYFWHFEGRNIKTADLKKEGEEVCGFRSP